MSGGCREIGLAGYLNDLNARHHELGSYPPRGDSLAGDTLAVVRAEVGPLPDPNPRAIVDRPQAHTLARGQTYSLPTPCPSARPEPSPSPAPTWATTTTTS